MTMEPLPGLSPLDALAEETQGIDMAARQQADQARVDASRPPEVTTQAAPTQAAPTPAPAASPAKKPSLMDTARTVVGALSSVRQQQAQEVDAALSAGIIRAPGVLAGSLLDFGQDTGRFVGEIADAGLVRAGPAGRFIAEQNRQSDAMQTRAGADMRRRLFGAQDSTASWSDLLSARSSLGKAGNDQINQATAVITASVATGSLGARTMLGRALAGGAVGGGVIQDPDEERLSNGLQALGVHTQFTDWLAQDDADGALESRFKGALEGVLIEGGVEAVFHVAKAWRYLAKGQPELAAQEQALAREAAGLSEGQTELVVGRVAPQRATQENLDKAFASVRTEEARAVEIETNLKAQQQEMADALGGQGGTTAPGTAAEEVPQAAKGPEVLPAGTRLGDAPDGAGDPLQDARVALERSGVQNAQEVLGDTLTLAGDGRIVVDRASKAAADEAGFGRAFVSLEDAGALKDDVLFATEGRVVGSMGRTDVEAFQAEVAAYRGTEGDIPATNPAGQFKLRNLGDPENVQPVLRALIDGVAPKGVRSMDEMQATAREIADSIGQDPTAMLAYARQVAGVTGNLDSAAIAVKTMWTRLSGNVDRHLAGNLDDLDEAGIQAIAADIHNAMTFSGSFAQVKTGLGRGTYALRATDVDTYVANVGRRSEADLTPGPLDADPVLPRTKEEIKDWLDSWKAFNGDPAGRALWLENKFKVPAKGLYLRASVANLFTANLLSAPRTLALNVVGPSVIGAIRTLEKTSGGALGSLNPLIPAARRAELRATSTAAATAYIQTFQDMQDSLRWALEAAKRGSPVLGGGGSIADGAGQLGPISPALLQAANAAPAWQYSAGNVINMWPRALQKVNAGMDEFAKRLSYFGEARATHLVEGASRGLRGTELNEYVRGQLVRMTDTLGHATDEATLAAAERTTLTGRVGSEGSMARGFASGVSAMRQAFPESRFILPIFNVPANALGETLRRVPGVNVLFKESNRELAGELGAVRQAEAYGRFITGTAMLGSGLALSRMGLITGSGPTDPSDRALWLQSGHQPYSIRMGDQWVDYSRYDIVGALLAIPATLYDRSVHMQQDKGWEHAMYGGIAAMAEYFKDRAALSSVSDLLSFSGSPSSNPESYFKRLAGSTVANLAVPNFITAIGRNPTDDVVRARASVADYILDKLPIASQTLDPMRNVLGEYIHKPQDTLAENVLPVTMSAVKSWEDDPEMDELGRLYEATGYAAGITAPRAMAYGEIDPRTIQLENGRSLYDALMRNRATVTVEGRTLRQALGDLFNSQEYADAIDSEDAQRKADSQGRASRAYLIANTFKDYTAAARNATARENPTAARWLAISKAKSDNKAATASVTSREAFTNPDLLASLGIDIADYESALTEEN